MPRNDHVGPGSGRLAGKSAIVTGGSRGIGAAIVRAFVAEGCRVAFCHHDDEERAKALRRGTRFAERIVLTASSDVADEDAVARFTSDAACVLGGVDILVNNAGIGGEVRFEDISLQLFDRMVAVHLRGTFLMSRACYGQMKERRSGRIINITSQLAYLGASGAAHYCAAKAGVIGLMRALAREAAPFGVLVNAIAPDATDTELLAEMSPDWRAWKKAALPIGRFGRPEEIAPTAVMLASADGSFFVGQTLSPNGGDVML